MVGSIEAVLRALNEAQVRYLVVGGVAVVLHGHLRTTADLDLVLQLSPDNAARGMRALTSLGYRPRAPVPAADFADAEIRRRWVEEKGLTVFSLWSPEHRELEVDVFVAEPFDFDEAYARSTCAPLVDTFAQVAALEDLVALKRLAGRAQDLADIEALERLGAGRE
ncbi:MAG: hypothetical protein RL653_30 [Pseudomonadota bacterium]|jgi:hypothetical protein